MDKVIHSSKTITPFGGLNFSFKAIKSKGLDVFIDKCIGQRSKTGITSDRGGHAHLDTDQIF